MILNVEIRSIYCILTIVNFTLEVLITMHVNCIQLDLRLIQVRSVNCCAGVQFLPSFTWLIDTVVHRRSQSCSWWCQLNALNNSNLLYIIIWIISTDIETLWKPAQNIKTCITLQIFVNMTFPLPWDPKSTSRGLYSEQKRLFKSKYKTNISNNFCR